MNTRRPCKRRIIRFIHIDSCASGLPYGEPKCTAAVGADTLIQQSMSGIFDRINDELCVDTLKVDDPQ